MPADEHDVDRVDAMLTGLANGDAREAVPTPIGPMIVPVADALGCAIEVGDRVLFVTGLNMIAFERGLVVRIGISATRVVEVRDDAGRLWQRGGGELVVHQTRAAAEGTIT